jgi:beta-galactosidase
MMRKLIVLLLILVAAAAAQPYFKPADLMTIGVYYYPEAWPSSQWARDMANIRKLGLEFVHMGEFAWAFMEPEEGRFDLDWLARNVELASAQGLKVVLCTPSATPPVWLVRKHPEVLMVDAGGRRMEHGSRTQACWTVPRYREYVAGIITKLAERFGQDPRVWGWQIDNELSHYSKQYCYCDFCQEKFRSHLRRKYGTIQELNDAWGNTFWSQMYQNFDQIRIPNQAELVQQINPHAQLDFQRWFAEEVADYIRFQAETLRRHTRNQWITTNYMALHKEVNPALSARDLDVNTWTHYPVHGNLNEGPLGFRLGSAPDMSFMHDFMRALGKPHGLMELQPGQVNWGDVNPQPYPGAVRMWIMRAFAAGANLVCTYRYRQPLFGAELYHYGLAGPDGVTVTTGGHEYAWAMKDVRMLRQLYKADAKEPRAYAARRAGFLYSYDNRWDIDNHKQTARWDTNAHLMKHYRALKRLGAPVDVITEEKDFAGYPFLIAPAYQMVDGGLVERFRKYAEAGGHLVLTCRTAQNDRNGHLWEAPWAGPVHDLIGAEIPAYDVLTAPVKGTVTAAARSYDWAAWGDQLKPRAGTTVLARYADQFYAGTPAATTRKLGKGTVTYIGVESLAGELEYDLLKRVYTAAGVATESFPPQYVVDWRDGFWVATNFSEKKLAIPAGPAAKIVIGTREIGPAGVAVWVE